MPEFPKIEKFPVAIVIATSRQINAKRHNLLMRALDNGSRIGMEMMTDTKASSDDNSWILEGMNGKQISFLTIKQKDLFPFFAIRKLRENKYK